jgi:virginiamycin B lyase
MRRSRLGSSSPQRRRCRGTALRNPGSRRKLARAIGIALSDEVKAARLLGEAPTEPTIVERPIPLRAFGAFDLRLAHDARSVWVSGSAASRILLYPALGTGIAPTVYKLPPGSFPHGIAVGPDDALYIAETGTNIGGNAIGRLTLSGQYRQYPLPAGAGGPWGITVGPDHEIWFTEVGAGKVGRLDPTSGDLVEFSLRTPDSQPQGIVLRSDGALWGTEVAANQIFRITGDGHVSEFRIPTPNSLPVSITAGRGGVLWVSESDAGKLLRISPPNRTREFALPSGGRPYGLMSAPDGNVWFADRGRNRIGLVTPAGRIFEFGLPTENAQPIAVVPVGPGKFAFVEFVGNQIGTLDF